MQAFRVVPRTHVATLVIAAVVGSLTIAVAGRLPALAAPAQKHFQSPEEAVQELIGAARAGDEKALLAVLGPKAQQLVDSGDPVADANGRDRFVASYDEAHSIAKDGEAKAILETGKDQWPFPIPLVKDDAGWRFDDAAGKDEILDRRIGWNELATIQVCLAYVDAQREYYARNPDGAKLPHYAAHVHSSPGKRDGLYWETKEGEEPSPLGPLITGARAEGYAAKGGTAGKSAPYHGYYYRILTAQGPDAPGGAYDYVVRGEMFGGFALIAYPAEYGNSGVMTFEVNHDGVVYEKDLGPKTASIAAAIKTFNPDSTWKRQ